jgi:hypothetical protein
MLRKPVDLRARWIHQALSRMVASQVSAPSIGIIRNPAWAHARLLSGGAAGPRRPEHNPGLGWLRRCLAPRLVHDVRPVWCAETDAETAGRALTLAVEPGGTELADNDVGDELVDLLRRRRVVAEV